MPNELYTVGHSNHPIEHFIAILKLNEIEAIVDVRTSPFSKFSPQYNQPSLKSFLSTAGIKYIHMGKQLGARREEKDCYTSGQVDFSLVSKSPLFIEGIMRLREGTSKMKVAIMCAEKDPLTCHRTILVSRYARQHIPCVKHILSDGSIEEGSAAELRLRRECGFPEAELFESDDELLEKAYQMRAHEIAFKPASPQDKDE